MDKLLQDDKELQDEELYALLDKALESDRLCVSEELIQKTLRRVEGEGASNVVSLEQKRKRKYPYMRYACVAAAAMLVLAVGVRTFNGKEFATENARKEAAADGMYSKSGNGNGLTQDSVMDSSESEAVASMDDADLWKDEVDDGSARGEYHYSQNERDGHPDAATDLNEEKCTPLTGCTAKLSAKLVTALTELGYGNVASEADYWEFVQREDYWEEELLRRLAACDFNKEYVQDGSYSYVLAGKTGMIYTISSDEPLDAVVGIETEGGMLWILFGRNVSLYEE